MSMASARDHLGSKCPQCAGDILQAVPSSNRMPPSGDACWCPGCDSVLTVAELEAKPRRSGFFGRLFGRAQQG